MNFDRIFKDSVYLLIIIIMSIFIALMCILFHRPMRPSPPYLGLILAATGKLEAFLAKGCQAQRQGHDEEELSSDEEDDAVLANLVKSTFIKENTPKKESASTSSVDSPRSTSPN